MTPKIDKWMLLQAWLLDHVSSLVTCSAVVKKMDELDKVEIQLNKERLARTDGFWVRHHLIKKGLK